MVFEGGIDESVGYYLKSDVKQFRWSGIDGDHIVHLIDTEVFVASNATIFMNSEPINIKMEFILNEDFNDLVAGLSIASVIGGPIVGMLYNDYNTYRKFEKGRYSLLFTIPRYSLATGNYEVSFNISIHNVKKFTSEKSKLNFSVLSASELGNKFYIENHPEYNSVCRPNWFTDLQKME